MVSAAYIRADNSNKQRLASGDLSGPAWQDLCVCVCFLERLHVYFSVCVVGVCCVVCVDFFYCRVCMFCACVVVCVCWCVCVCVFLRETACTFLPVCVCVFLRESECV